MLIQRARLRLETENVSALASRAKSAVAALGGYVQRAELNEGRSFEMTARVPAMSLDPFLDTLRQGGRLRDERRNADDVTEQVVDLDARLGNLISVRNRLREHLTRAVGIDDVLTLERELARVQGEIDSLEARLKRLRGSVAMAEVSLTATPRRVLGPLGLLVAGTGWVLQKLFVIRY